ncbi:MAG: roadblock/LC7 domain-containing protein [candidate division Zixibacteria bacterium]|nr:roadblock/LC7 domain-containing protein [candidate division Zixibacteria bacterium]MDH3938385.1 roadblock/LC7 domain-containing protein [candidate division Zixibacteria bacterium]MDH4035166.1 roadblock/LC7 domain-containing protein [candidate division Zixibacteria bacterium]
MASASEIDSRIVKCQKILAQDPNSQIFAALAEAMRRKGDLEKAFRVCQNGLKVHPSYGSAHVVMAKINLDRQLFDWAEIEARKAAECDGWTRATELLIAEIHIYKGEFQPAIKLLTKLHESDPANSQITKLLEIARQIPQQHQALIGEKAVSGAHKAPVAEPGGTGELADKTTIVTDAMATPEDKPSTPLSVEQILEKVISLPGVDGTLFINREGLVVKSEWTMRLDSTVCGAIALEFSRGLDQSLTAGFFGKVHSVLVETGGHTFYTVRSHEGMFMFVANSKTNLGALRMKLDALLLGQGGC